MKNHEEPPTPEKMFGALLRRRRMAKGLSQQELADRMPRRFGWRQSTVAKTEAAGRPIRLDEAVALGEVLGRPLVRFADQDLPAAKVAEIARLRAEILEVTETMRSAQAALTAVIARRNDLQQRIRELETEERATLPVLPALAIGYHTGQDEEEIRRILERPVSPRSSPPTTTNGPQESPELPELRRKVEESHGVRSEGGGDRG